MTQDDGPVLRINQQLVRDRGRTLINRMRKELENSSIILTTETARNDAGTRIRALVDRDGWDLNPVERGALMQYVKDGVLGTDDPDSRLEKICSDPKLSAEGSPLSLGHINPAGTSSGTSAGPPSGLLAKFFYYFFICVYGGAMRSPWQKCAGRTILTASFVWLGLLLCLCVSLCHGSQILSWMVPYLGWTWLALFVVGPWSYGRFKGWQVKKKLQEHPEMAAAYAEQMRQRIQASAARRQGRSQARKSGSAGALIWLILFVALFITRAQLTTHHSSFNGDPKLVHYFPAQLDINVKRNPLIDYDQDIAHHPYYVYVPPNYTGKQPFGLIVYISPSDTYQDVPSGWKDVLAQRQLLFVVPQLAGNHSISNIRDGLAVLGAFGMIHDYNVDRSRIYVAGLSGGARAAGETAFWQSDLFSGTIQSCGADFYRPVKHERTTNWTDTNGNSYGVLDTSPGDVSAAKEEIRFVLITGTNDFRHPNLLDLYENGFHKEGFHCKLIDVPGMGHADASAEVLNEALDYISGKQS